LVAVFIGKAIPWLDGFLSKDSYAQRTVRVMLDGIGEVEAFTYTAEASSIDERLKPTTEYRDTVLAGAKEHGLRTSTDSYGRSTCCCRRPIEIAWRRYARVAARSDDV
jgi:hypothetical protein